MELFTLGADRGAYTEEDVRELARSLTGWDYDWSDSSASTTSTGTKATAGTPATRPSSGRRDAGRGGRRAHGRRAHKHPSFFVAKLWSYFIPTPPDAARRPSSRRSTRARATRSARARGDPVLAAALRRPAHGQAADRLRRRMLRARRLGITDNLWSWVLSGAGQRVYYPPDVAGWDDKRWLDTNTTLGRWQAVYTCSRATPRTRGRDYPAETRRGASQARDFWGAPTLTPAAWRALQTLRPRRDPADGAPIAARVSARTPCASCSPPPPTTRRAESHGLPLQRLLKAQAGRGLRGIEPGMPTPAGTGLNRRAFLARWQRARAVGVRRHAAVAARVRGGHRRRRRLLAAGADLDLPVRRPRLAVGARAGRRPALRLAPAHPQARPAATGDASPRTTALQWHPNAAPLRDLHLAGKVT